MAGKQKNNEQRISIPVPMAFLVQKNSNGSRQAYHYDNDDDDGGCLSNIDKLTISADEPPSSTLYALSASAPISRPSMTSSNLSFGEYSEKGVQFAPLKLINRFPHEHVVSAYEQEVATFFKENLFSSQDWDLFILRDHRRNSDLLLLVPSYQFQRFLHFTNASLNGSLAIPRGVARDDYFLTFGEWGLPVPRFLGRVQSCNGLKDLENRAKALEFDDLSGLSPPRVQLYYNKMDHIYDSFKSQGDRKQAVEIRNKRVERLKGNSRMVKRVQRYLGLRKPRLVGTPSLPDPLHLSWNANRPSPYKPTCAVRFVCVDVEAMERNRNIVTEIGLAILDTSRIENIAPGERGENWASKIEAHHFRIEEYSHFVNKRFVKGCPEAFHFGKSVFVPRMGMARVLGQVIGENRSMGKKPVILVGHDVKQDLKYLKKVGYNVWRLAHVLDEADTLWMFQRIARRQKGCGLETICHELGTSGLDFHNAGNDAVYTLRAMIAMIIKRTIQGPDFYINSEEPPVADELSDGEADDGGHPVLSQEPEEVAKLPRNTDTRQRVKW
ncbi:hypothetical protein F4809DRAFT_542890 [Biscogniauxia mediterranea]|nr:hypothetical protein F4809DRAFT_542890 [Biscogniauxia mediterranea]